MSLQKLISTLPRFNSEKLTNITSQIPTDFQTLFDHFQDEPSITWLESGPQKDRYIFIGQSWSIEGYPDIWKITVDDKTTTLQRKKNESYRQLLNTLEQSWLCQQVPYCKLSIYLSYEAAWDEEVRLHSKPSTKHIPDILIICPETIIIQSDHQSFCSHPNFKYSKNNILQNDNYAAGCTITPELSQKEYLTSIDKVKEFVRQGHSFQVNLSQKINCTGPIDFHTWSKHILSKEAGAFSSYIKNKSFSILSLSPERLLQKKRDGTLITRPIAGTLPKGNHQDPRVQLQAFKNNPKELAEHNMLIDLERNDLGKICEAGSVQVKEYLSIEELPHLYHLVSEVQGKIDQKNNIGDAIMSLFPGGTITGCPKLETMHIIDQLEKNNREAYTGSVGYLAPDHFDLNILIRTALFDHIESCIRMRFGGGLVWDSIPEKEYLETLAKSKGLILSLIQGGAKLDSDHRPFRQFFT